MGLSQEMAYRRFENGRSEQVIGQVVREALVRLHVNGRELAMLMCTPQALDCLALGFLPSEGLIRGLEDVRKVVVCPSGACVEVWLRDAHFEPPASADHHQRLRRRDHLFGHDRGRDAVDRGAAGHSPPAWPADGRLQAGQQTRGVHTSALAEDEELLVVVEDVGRHNTIDKLWGRCLRAGIDPAGADPVEHRPDQFGNAQQSGPHARAGGGQPDVTDQPVGGVG